MYTFAKGLPQNWGGKKSMMLPRLQVFANGRKHYREVEEQRACEESEGGTRIQLSGKR